MLRLLLLWAGFAQSVLGNISQRPLSQAKITTASSEYLVSAEFDGFMTQVIDEWALQGVAVAVVHKDSSGKWRHDFKGWGNADRYGNPVTKHTLFNIASNTKHFTALSVGLLVENSTFPNGWKTKIHTLLPDWEPQDPQLRWHGDIVDILSHRSGLPRHDLSYSPGESIDEVVRSVKHLRPSAEFREAWQYNNIMYVTGAYLVEQYSNLSFPDFLHKHIFSPLGMNASLVDPVAAFETGELAEGYLPYECNVSDGKGWEKNKYRPTPFFDSSLDARMNAGAGGIISNAEDLAIWVQTLLSDGRHPETNETIIPKAAIDHITTGFTIQPARAPYPDFSAGMYGHGQMMHTYQGHQIIFHGGAVPGFKTQIARFPNDNLGIIVLTNSENGNYAMEVIKNRIADEYLGLKKIDWNSRYKETILKNKKKKTPRRNNAPLPTVPIEDLAGTYTHPAYGTAELCLFPSNSSSSSYSSIAASSPSCLAVITSISPLLPASSSDAPRLISLFPRLWGTHFLASHFSSNTFNLSMYDLIIPSIEPTARNKSEPAFVIPAEMDEGEEGPTLTFDYADSEEDESENGKKVAGFGLRGLWGAGPGVPMLGGEGVKERSEVWFTRVEV